MNDMPIHELRFVNRAAWAAAFDRLLEHPDTAMCVARPRDLSLRVRTSDPSSLQVDGRILESGLPEAS